MMNLNESHGGPLDEVYRIVSAVLTKYSGVLTKNFDGSGTVETLAVEVVIKCQESRNVSVITALGEGMEDPEQHRSAMVWASSAIAEVLEDRGGANARDAHALSWKIVNAFDDVNLAGQPWRLIARAND